MTPDVVEWDPVPVKVFFIFVVCFFSPKSIYVLNLAVLSATVNTQPDQVGPC